MGGIATPSLQAAIINKKYVNSNLLDRIAGDFQANGLRLSKQTMSNWTVWSAERYFLSLYEWMEKWQFEVQVNQCDEMPLEVIHDGRPAGSQSYMWVHLTSGLSPVPKIIIYEYQWIRYSDYPKEYYKGFTGVLMTDSPEYYHKLERDLEGVLPKGETVKELIYCLNQEKYLKVFLTDGEIPIDDLAGERAMRNFTIGCKNWATTNTVCGAQASAIIYGLTEIVRVNNLNVYYYVRYLLTELPQLI